MKLVTSNNGKRKLKLSQAEWEKLGKDAGWIKKKAAHPFSSGALPDVNYMLEILATMSGISEGRRVSINHVLRDIVEKEFAEKQLDKELYEQAVELVGEPKHMQEV